MVGLACGGVVIVLLLTETIKLTLDLLMLARTLFRQTFFK